jgi:threonine synthase
LISWLLSAGISSAVEDSSGNAGASFAAYASSAGIQGRVYIPAYASGPKRVQIESYGAEVVPVPGPRSNAADAVLEDVKKGAVYASHAYLPHGTAGIATIAYELVKQTDQVPRTIILPVGHGSLLLGIALGFEFLLRSGSISQMPRLVGVQAAACAPLWKAFQKGSPTPVSIEGQKTAAEGVSIVNPYHGKEVIAAVKQSDGFFVKVEEEDILTGREKLSALGIYVEPTSALVWSGLSQTLPELEAPIISIMTGHGLKSS